MATPKTEEWRSIEGWPYEVSSEGRVRRNGRILTPMWCGKPGKKYATVRLCDNDRVKDRKVHQLVAEVFIGQCAVGGVVRHKNDDRTNNTVENLEYGSVKQNAHDAVKNGRHKQMVVCPETADRIKTRRLAGESGRKLAAEYGISEQAVCDIYKGRRATIGTNS